MNRRHALAFALAAGPFAPTLRAANDPRPDPVLAAVLGEWRGTRTVREPGPPERLLTQPSRLFISAIAPDEIALHFVHDAAGQPSYAYERLRFEFASDTLVWISGAVERTALVGRIVSSASDGALKRYVVDTTKDQALSRYTFELSASSFTLKKDEIDAAGQAVNRSRYGFSRPA